MGGRPTVAVFARDLSDNLAGLVKQIDAKVADNEKKRMGSFVVLLASKDEKIAKEKEVKAFATKHGLKTPLTIYEGTDGPKDYKIGPGANVTVVMWVQKDVKGTFAFGPGQLDDAATANVMKATAKILE